MDGADSNAPAAVGGAAGTSRDHQPASARAATRARAVRVKRRPPITEIKLNWAQRFTFWGLVALTHLLSLIPDFVLYPLGIAGGCLAFVLDRRHVRIGTRNLEIAFPERSPSERRRILRASYVNIGRSVADYIRLGGFFYKRFRRTVAWDRYPYWEEVHRRYPGKGGLVLSAHFGNFELLAIAYAMRGHEIELVHHTQRFLAGDALMTFVRARAGVSIIRKHAAARPVLKALRADRLVGIPFDQNAKGNEAVFVPFFSELAATSSALARLVAISGAPVIPVFIVRERGRLRHRIEILDEIPEQRSGDPAADIAENTRRYVRVIEDIVRRYPEQFLWTHRRYRTRPPGAPPIYRD